MIYDNLKDICDPTPEDFFKVFMESSEFVKDDDISYLQRLPENLRAKALIKLSDIHQLIFEDVLNTEWEDESLLLNLLSETPNYLHAKICKKITNLEVAKEACIIYMNPKEYSFIDFRYFLNWIILDKTNLSFIDDLENFVLERVDNPQFKSDIVNVFKLRRSKIPNSASFITEKD